MDTIKNYIENIFVTLPNTSEVLRMKEELLSNMEDKYLELKSKGKSENEAIGIVISEFGNIDEIINELEIPVETPIKKEKVSKNFLSLDKVKEYLNVKKHTSLLVSIGVWLILLGVGLLTLTSHFIEDGLILKSLSIGAKETIQIIPLFLFLVPAVGLFIYSGFQIEKYKFIDSGDFSIGLDSKSFLETKLNTGHSKKVTSLIVGVSLCIISPFIVIIGEAFGKTGETLGTTLLLIVIGFAVFIFINSSSVEDGCKKLLKTGDYEVSIQKNNKIIGAVASIVWPIATAIFLFWSFMYNSWNISWIVFPITGVLFGAFCAAYNIIHSGKETI